jgi:hypothetical protein
MLIPRSGKQSAGAGAANGDAADRGGWAAVCRPGVVGILDGDIRAVPYPLKNVYIHRR